MKQKIAILIPVSSRDAAYKSVKDINFFKILFPSFLTSLEPEDKEKFKYGFYLGYDKGDLFYDNEENLEKIREKFYQGVKKGGIELGALIKCENTEHSPATVWNILFKKAYADGYDFFYQLGDDIEIITLGWSSEFVKVLEQHNFIGVTGPLEKHYQKILTQTFVSRKHMEIFGYYFTPIVKNWYCDDWIHNVYKPGYNFWAKNKLVRNISAYNSGPRYSIKKIPLRELKKQIKQDRKKFREWLVDKRMSKGSFFKNLMADISLDLNIKGFFRKCRRFIKSIF